MLLASFGREYSDADVQRASKAVGSMPDVQGVMCLTSRPPKLAVAFTDECDDGQAEAVATMLSGLSGIEHVELRWQSEP